MNRNKDGQLQLFQSGGTGGIKLYSTTGTSGTSGNIYMSSDNTVSVQNAILYARPNVANTTPATPTIFNDYRSAAFYVGSSSVGIGPSKSAFTINIDGRLSWGIENTTGTPDNKDTYLYRNSAGELKTDSDLTVAGNLKMGSTGDVNLYRSATNTLKTDGNVNVSGNLNLGSTGDTILYRSASDTIRTNNLLYIYRDPSSYGLAIANTTTSGPTCFAIRGDGRVEWGPGLGNSRDTFLSRSTNGGLQVGSAVSFPYVSKSVDFDMTSDYVNYYTIDCTAANITVTLPSASVVGTGRVYKIKSSVSGTVTVNVAGGQLIEGASSKTITTQYSFLTVQSTGSKWITI